MASKWVLLTDKDRERILDALMGKPPYGKIADLDNRIKVSSAKGKGAKFQIDVCKYISQLIGIPFLQGNDDSLILPRNSGGNGVDIILRGKAKELFPFSVEAKNQEKLDLVSAIEQAKTNVGAGTDWLLVHRRKALSTDIVIMSWEAFAKIYGK